MQPEAVVIQKPMDAGQATLANGVKCGGLMKAMTTGYGWHEWILFTRALFPFHFDPKDVTVPATDFARRVGVAGKTILALTSNKSIGKVAILIEWGEDEDNPGAIECRVVEGEPEEVLSLDLRVSIARQRF